jgi:hypothetical protein
LRATETFDAPLDKYWIEMGESAAAFSIKACADRSGSSSQTTISNLILSRPTWASIEVIVFNTNARRYVQMQTETSMAEHFPLPSQQVFYFSAIP